MKRRTFLKLSAASGVSLAGTTAASNANTTITDRKGWLNATQHSFDVEANQSQRIRSVHGVLNYTMSVELANPVVNGTTLNFRTYNGKYPADTLIARPGDVLKIHLVNNLPASAEDNYMPTDINIPHGFNNTNLHTHGLNVSPEGDEDNVLLTIHPGEDFYYNIKIPEDHPSGTSWYHPHKHGSALHQLASGMAGFLLIESSDDDLNKLPEIRAAKTIDLAFHELIFDVNGEVPSVGRGEADVGNPNPDASARNPILNLFKGDARLQYTINGLAVNEGEVKDPQNPENNVAGKPPVLHMRPGEVQRWRFGMHCHLQTYRFELEGHQLNVAAWDGITADELTSHAQLVMGPGNRVDLLIKASDTPGTYAFKMVREQFGEKELFPGAPLFVTPDAFTEELPVFNVIVENSPLNMVLPAALNPPMKRLRDIINHELTVDLPIFNPINMALPAALNPPTNRLPYILDHEISRYRHIEFKVTGDVFFDPNTFAFVEDTRQYYINNMKFSGNRINQTMLLGTAEEWTITNNHRGGAQQFPQINHPFHIHVNWFQVMEIHHTDGSVEYPNNGNGLWVDTIDVPFGGKTVIRHRFENFTGIFPYHCHVIAHEDEGMMHLVEVVDPTPVRANVMVATGGTVKSTDVTERVTVEFAANAFPFDTQVAYYYHLDPKHDITHGLVGLERYFGLSSLVALSEAGTVTINFPLELSLGETYDPDTVMLYRSDGAGGWTTDGIEHVSRELQSGKGVLVSNIETLHTEYFAVLATLVSGPVFTPMVM